MAYLRPTLETPQENYALCKDGRKKKMNVFRQNVVPLQCFLSDALTTQSGPWEKWQVEPFAVSAEMGQLWDTRLPRVVGTGGGSPLPG